MKAILVLDNILGGVPESCADCPLEYDNLCCILVKNHYRKREDGCPLRTLPEECNMGSYKPPKSFAPGELDLYVNGILTGWNGFRAKLLGEGVEE